MARNEINMKFLWVLLKNKGVRY